MLTANNTDLLMYKSISTFKARDIFAICACDALFACLHACLCTLRVPGGFKSTTDHADQGPSSSL